MEMMIATSADEAVYNFRRHQRRFATGLVLGAFNLGSIGIPDSIIEQYSCGVNADMQVKLCSAGGVVHSPKYLKYQCRFSKPNGYLNILSKLKF